MVISHYAGHNLEETLRVWASVVSHPQIQPYSPYLFLYCKNSEVAEEDLDWFAQHGEVHHLPNIGRESHTYVWHILHNFDDMAHHTLFHQDIPDDMSALTQRLNLFSPSTGLLGLAHLAKCTCRTCFLHHIPKVREIWAMVQQTFCEPGRMHVVFLRGALVASSKR